MLAAALALTACANPTEPVHLTFKALSVGTRNACAIATTGATYCWGDNSTGQVGSNDTTGTSAPIPVLVAATQPASSFSQLSVSGFYACALASSGAAYCWGLNAYGELGIGTTT
jgi:alpha-tubulin suppressor-like RCC1 family protein